MRPLHIVHVIDSLGLGGAERMLVDLANATVADGHRVSVCVTRRGTALATALDPGIELIVLDRRRTFSVDAFARFAAWVRRGAVDVLHVHMRSSLKFVLPLLATRAIRTPVVVHDHYGTIETDAAVPAWFRVGHRWIAHYVGVYTKLEGWARDAGMPAGRTSTIPNALDLSRLRVVGGKPLGAALGLAPAVRVGVLVATVRRDKGIETLLDALARVPHRDRTHVAIAGAIGDPGYADELRAQVDALGLGGTVEFLGPRGDVPELLAGADFGLLSSHTESGPLVLIEYLAASLPIVFTRVGDIGRRVAELGVAGAVSPRDARAFAAALVELLALEPAARRARGDLGHRVLNAGWDIRAAMPRWYEVYRSVLR